ncbi:hypothetical protein VNO77_19146 [Canavalia gladiata]|uniref:Uncharacterized protein n=1 Tax=Canavalia gladiata TaxID=3824 RepID=A0AAN9LQU4_CANGL
MHGDNFQYPGPWYSVGPSHTPVFASFGGRVLLELSIFCHKLQTWLQLLVLNPHLLLDFRRLFQIIMFLCKHHRQHTGPPRNPSIVSVQSLSTPTNVSLPFPVSLSQITRIGLPQTLLSSMPLPMFGISPSPIPNQRLTSLGFSSGQNKAPATIKMSIGPNNMGPRAPPVVPPIRPVSLHQQPYAAFKPPRPNMSMMPRFGTFPPH